MAQRFPAILDMLAAGDLSVTTARLVGKIVTQENHKALLAEASGLSKRAVEELVARYAPRPDVPTSLRKLPVRTVQSTPPPPASVVERSERTAAPSTPSVHPAVAAAPRASVTPLAPSRYELKVTVGQETREKLRLAQDLLRHAIPSGDTAEILDRALTLLLADLERKKFAAVKRPRKSRGVAIDSREPAAEVKRAVRERDGNRCAYIAPSGRRCSARAFLEFHHLKMYVNGGQATVDNLSLRCKQHNQYESDLFFEGIVRESAAAYEASDRWSTRSGTVREPLQVRSRTADWSKT